MAAPDRVTAVDYSGSATLSAGAALRSLITLAVLPPSALSSIPAIAVITIRNGGKLPSETFAWVPTSACTSSNATP